MSNTIVKPRIYTTISASHRNVETDWAERRVAFYRKRAERKWEYGFLAGLAMATAITVAWFYPMVNP